MPKPQKSQDYAIVVQLGSNGNLASSDWVFGLLLQISSTANAFDENADFLLEREKEKQPWKLETHFDISGNRFCVLAKQRNEIKIAYISNIFFNICFSFGIFGWGGYIWYLEDGFLILDMFNLLEPDDVVYGEDFEGEVLPTWTIPAQADACKGACMKNI